MILSEYIGIYDLVVPKDNMLRKINELIDFLFEAFKRVYEASDDGASIYIFHADAKGLIIKMALMVMM